MALITFRFFVIVGSCLQIYEKKYKKNNKKSYFCTFFINSLPFRRIFHNFVGENHSFSCDMKKTTLFLYFFAVATLSFAQGHEPANDGSKPNTITLTDAERELVKANNNFALRLFREARTEESAILSPLSITYALGMLNNGATGQTQQEINDVLGFGNAGADAINAFCKKMLTEAPYLDDTKVMIGSTRNISIPQPQPCVLRMHVPCWLRIVFTGIYIRWRSIFCRRMSIRWQPSM